MALSERSIDWSVAKHAEITRQALKKAAYPHSGHLCGQAHERGPLLGQGRLPGSIHWIHPREGRSQLKQLIGDHGEGVHVHLAQHMSRVKSCSSALAIGLALPHT